MGNKVTNSVGAGILTGSNNLIQGNHVSESGNAGIGTEGSNNIILDNQVTSNALWGIAIHHTTATENLVQGNEVTENGWRGIDVDYGATNNIIRDNKALDNGEFDLFDWSYPPGPLVNTWEDNIYDTSNF